MHLGALERRVGDEVSIPRGPQKRWADLDDKERAEREAKQLDYLRSRKEQISMWVKVWTGLKQYDKDHLAVEYNNAYQEIRTKDP